MVFPGSSHQQLLFNLHCAAPQSYCKFFGSSEWVSLVKPPEERDKPGLAGETVVLLVLQLATSKLVNRWHWAISRYAQLAFLMAGMEIPLQKAKSTPEVQHNAHLKMLDHCLVSGFMGCWGKALASEDGTCAGC